jgi:hypothetical protein
MATFDSAAPGGRRLTTKEAVDVVRRHFDHFFPKLCLGCGARFETLHHYMLGTRPAGSPVLFETEEAPNIPPIGWIEYAFCPCGNALALGTDGMDSHEHVALLNWLWLECRRRGLAPARVIEGLRADL